MEQNLADWDTIAGVPTHENRYIDLGDWELDQAVSDLQAVMGDLGELPIGATLSDFISSQKGTVTINLDGQIVLAHGGDAITLNGGKSGIIVHMAKKQRTRTKKSIVGWGVVQTGYNDWSGFKTSERDYTITAGTTQEFKNTEDDLNDIDLYMTLVDVLKTPAEIEAQRKQAALDVTLKDPNATAQAKALAETQYKAAQQEAEATAAMSAAKSSAAGAAATGAAIESFVWPVVILGTAGMGLLLAWLYLAKDKV